VGPSHPGPPLAEPTLIAGSFLDPFEIYRRSSMAGPNLGGRTRYGPIHFWSVGVGSLLTRLCHFSLFFQNFSDNLGFVWAREVVDDHAAFHAAFLSILLFARQDARSFPSPHFSLSSYGTEAVSPYSPVNPPGHSTQQSYIRYS
jgi:hypothetical protein